MLTEERIRERVRNPEGYWSLVEGVSTFDVAAMSDDLRALLARIDEMRADSERIDFIENHGFGYWVARKTDKGPSFRAMVDKARAALAQQHGSNDLVKARDEFLAISVAVWREIDNLSQREEGYKGLDSSVELRRREKAAWEKYRNCLERRGVREI